MSFINFGRVVVANRLSEENWRVLLLEAGGEVQNCLPIITESSIFKLILKVLNMSVGKSTVLCSCICTHCIKLPLHGLAILLSTPKRGMPSNEKSGRAIIVIKVYFAMSNMKASLLHEIFDDYLLL